MVTLTNLNPYNKRGKDGRENILFRETQKWQREYVTDLSRNWGLPEG